MSSVRAFLAIAIPPAIQLSLAEHIARLQKMSGGSVRWVPAENIHLTLKFLGEVENARLEALQNALSQACAAQPAFEISVGGLGAFPSLHRPRVLWAGVQAPPALAELHQKVEQAAAGAGFPAEAQSFSAHLTLGRVREPIGSISLNTLRAVLAATRIESLGAAPVDFIHLYRSELLPNGPRYSLLFKAPLAG
ncbi:MAG: RNA 2',3'-cyclic phosphodiesterase [Anaerolineales bacterium]